MRKLVVGVYLMDLAPSLNVFFFLCISVELAVYIPSELLHLEAVTVSTLCVIQPLCVAIFVVIFTTVTFVKMYSDYIRFRCTKSNKPMSHSDLND